LKDENKEEAGFDKSSLNQVDNNQLEHADHRPAEEIPHIHSGMLPDRLLNWLSVNKFSLFIAGLIIILVSLIWVLLGLLNSKVVYGGVTYKSSISQAALEKELNPRLAKYQIGFKYPDNTVKNYTLDYMGIKLDSAKTSDKLTAQRYGIKQMVIWWKPINGQVQYKIDSSKLGHFIANDLSQSISAPQDATIGFNGGNLVIGEAKEGLRVYLDQPSNSIMAHAQQFKTTPLDLKKRSIKPSLTAKDFEQYRGSINQIINQKIVFRIDSVSITPTPSDIATWLDLSTDTKAKKLNIAVNSGKVQQYIDRTTSRFTRAVKSQVEVTRSDGSKMVLTAGQNGVTVTNKSQISSEVATALLNGKGIDKTLVTKSTPFQTVNGAGSGKWIEVDVSVKRLYAYENGILVNSFPISAGAPATPTVLGSYKIYAKYAVQDMRGSNVDGSSYFQPNVRWISYFYGGYAIHGNYWRPVSWFGNINSSHGCVGMMDSQAQWVYNWAPIGTTIVTHS